MTQSDPTPRINMPRSAAAGDVIAVKTQISHRMETGFRRDTRGFYVPRKIINRFEVELDNVTVFAVNLNFAMSRDPIINFFLRAEKSGTYTFRWHDDDGSIYHSTIPFTLA